MADEKKQGLFGIEVDFSKDPDAERELQLMEQDMNEADESRARGYEPEFEEDLEDDSEDSLTIQRCYPRRSSPWQRARSRMCSA